MSEKKVTFYFFPSSYYSLKALLALYEKDVQFDQKIVSLIHGDAYEEWYMKLNPKGQVPLLEIDGKYYPESDAIINLIDEKFSSEAGSKLVPDMDSAMGQRVAEMRTILDAVPVPVVTFGSLANPSVQVDPVAHMMKMFSRNMIGTHKDLQRRQQAAKGDLQNAYERKVADGISKSSRFFEETYVKEVLDNLEQTFDTISDQLKQSLKDAGDNTDYWLCGPSFTAADISATMLIFRISLVGLASRYFSVNTRPEVYTYYQRLMKRPSVMKMMAMNDTTKSYVIKRTLKSYGKTALKIGAVVALATVAYVGYKEFMKISKGLFKG